MELKKIAKLYFKEHKSLAEIAKIYNTYPTKIATLLKRGGYKLRSKSEAQASALATGKVKHPTKGTKRSDEVKDQIGKKLHQSWNNLSDRERNKRSSIGKLIWMNMSDEEKENLRQKAYEGLRKASKEGSALEKFVYQAIMDAGYGVQMHVKGLIINTKLEVDLYIPSLNCVIEIDGPSHFEPVWGMKSLKRNIRADQEKAGLLLNGGFIIIRFRDLRKNHSQIYHKEVANIIIDELKNIEKNTPKNKYIELNINS